jgi:hypothetical protein
LAFYSPASPPLSQRPSEKSPDLSRPVVHDGAVLLLPGQAPDEDVVPVTE